MACDSQFESLAATLKGLGVSKKNSKIISSNAPRAVESAERLSQVLGVQFRRHSILESSEYSWLDLEGVTQLILRQGKSIVVVVTHDEYASELPAYFCRRTLHENFMYGWYYGLKRGEMVVIDLINKSFQKFAGDAIPTI